MKVAVLGGSAACAPHARAFRGCEGIDAAVFAASEDGLLAALGDVRVGAVAFAEAPRDIAGAVKGALLAGRHVFVSAAPALSEARYIEIDELARRRRRIAAFDTGFLLDERIAFVKKMAASPQPLWRPRYIRSVRAGGACDRINEIALSQIALASELMGTAPSRASAIAPRASGETDEAVMATLVFADGAAVTLHLAPDESQRVSETVVACDGRTIVFDPYDARAPLRIVAGSAHGFASASGGWRETASEHAPAGADRSAALAAAFVAAARAQDPAFGNAAQLGAAAAAWEAARRSIGASGEMTEIAPERPKRPELRLIRGRGRGRGGAAPALSLVEGTPLGDGAA
jgi:hypothetical protein